MTDAADPKIYVPVVCPNCGWHLDQTLSRIDVEASTPQAAEGSNQAAPTVLKFTARRSGPLDQECSIKATLAGTAGAADFEEGTAMSGIAVWPAGDGSPRSVEIKLNADRIVEGDEEATVTLSDAVDCTIGTAAVTVRIVDDDRPPTPGYDGNLPYGGQGIGTACLLGQPGNQKVTSTSNIMIRCERDGLIDRFQWNNRFNGHGRTGYSDGDGGVISWRLSVAENAQSSPIVCGKILGETRKITAPVKAASWQAEYAAAGGKGDCVNYFAEYPTIRFVKPVAVKVGQMLIFTQVQHGGGTVSINNCYTACRTYDDWSPFSLHKSTRQFKGSSLSTTRPEHYPVLLYAYTDGVIKGTGVCGDARGLSVEQECIMLGGKTRARQCITVPDWADGKVPRRVISWWGRYDKAATGDLRVRLKAAGGNPMGSADEGETFAFSQLSAGSIACRPDPKFGEPTKLVRHVFDPLPRPLKAGEVIYVEVTSTGSRFIGFRMARWLSYAPIGLRQADWALKGLGAMRDVGAGWQSLNVGKINHDLPLWLEF